MPAHLAGRSELVTEQPTSRHSMDATLTPTKEVEEPKLSMRGGGCIGDWYVNQCPYFKNHRLPLTMKNNADSCL